MIESGSLTPGIDSARFGLPPHTAVRYERPDPALERMIADYHMFDSEEHAVNRAIEWMLPNSPAIRIILADRPIRLALAGARYDPLPTACFFGPTSQAMEIEVSGGLTIGASLTPIGFARLLRTSAAELRDNVLPLEHVMPREQVAVLVERLRDHDRGRRVKAILDEFFLPLMSRPHRDEPELMRIMAALQGDNLDNLGDIADQLGIPSHRLLRLCQRHFGFPPKTLLMRARLLRSILTLKLNGNRTGYVGIDPAYFDHSHFVRDARRFLGMTPRQFLQLETPYLNASLRARAMVFGVNVAALQPATGNSLGA